jgi:hypothetical protein
MLLVLALTVFIPVSACFCAPPQKFGWRRTEKGRHGCKMVGVILLPRFVVVIVEEASSLEKIPGLIQKRGEGLRKDPSKKGRGSVLRVLHSKHPRRCPMSC